ncbi:hypothetical protein IT411_03780 [Candidatus Peregrinibacteria bacterium]|nr:hypothetical protein [Candidatus Peregrinibacteria bacterium]
MTINKFAIGLFETANQETFYDAAAAPELEIEDATIPTTWARREIGVFDSIGALNTFLLQKMRMVLDDSEAKVAIVTDQDFLRRVGAANAEVLATDLKPVFNGGLTVLIDHGETVDSMRAALAEALGSVSR